MCARISTAETHTKPNTRGQVASTARSSPDPDRGCCVPAGLSCAFSRRGMHIFIVKPQWMSAHISPAELSPVKFPLGCCNMSQPARGWSLKAVVSPALRHRSCWHFFVPKSTGLCTQFCLKLSFALHCFKSSSTGCMGAYNVL